MLHGGYHITVIILDCDSGHVGSIPTSHPMENELTWYGDQNYAIRQAIRRATEEMLDEVYDWNEATTAYFYKQLVEDAGVITLNLKNPSDIESSH